MSGVPGPKEMVEALSRLAVLPSPNEPDLENADKYVESMWAQVPMPTLDPAIWSDAVADVVYMADMVGTDPYLKRKKIRQHIKAMGQAVTKYRSLPMVAHIDGKFVIIDGHHRLAALWLMGQDRAAVWLVEEPA